MARSLTEITDFSAEEIKEVMRLAGEMKTGKISPKPLDGKAAALIFAKSSLRTRVSFEVGVGQLGGKALYITDDEVGLGKRESIADVAEVLSRYVDLIMLRTFEHDNIVKLAKYASVPVINGLTDLVHPCQVLCDYFTIIEHRPKLERPKVAYLGDGNNMANSWLNLAAQIPLELRIGTASTTQPSDQIMNKAKANSDSEILVTDDPKEAILGADVVYTDVWASMGQKNESEIKREILEKYQVNSSLLAGASPDCLVMHCLPAERGREITDEVMDGPHSIVFDQAENRLHGQKAIMVFLLTSS